MHFINKLGIENLKNHKQFGDIFMWSNTPSFELCTWDFIFFPSDMTSTLQYFLMCFLLKIQRHPQGSWAIWSCGHHLLWSQCAFLLIEQLHTLSPPPAWLVSIQQDSCTLLSAKINNKSKLSDWFLVLHQRSCHSSLQSWPWLGSWTHWQLLQFHLLSSKIHPLSSLTPREPFKGSFKRHFSSQIQGH